MRTEISWTDRVRNEVLLQVSEQRNILHTVNRRNSKWIGHILRRNGLLKHVTEEKTEVTRRRTRRRKHLVHDLKETGVYWKLKEEAIDRILWRTCSEREFGSILRQNKWPR